MIPTFGYRVVASVVLASSVSLTGCGRVSAPLAAPARTNAEPLVLETPNSVEDWLSFGEVVAVGTIVDVSQEVRQAPGGEADDKVGFRIATMEVDTVVRGPEDGEPIQTLLIAQEGENAEDPWLAEGSRYIVPVSKGQWGYGSFVMAAPAVEVDSNGALHLFAHEPEWTAELCEQTLEQIVARGREIRQRPQRSAAEVIAEQRQNPAKSDPDGSDADDDSVKEPAPASAGCS